jgi:hypothetical protein
MGRVYNRAVRRAKRSGPGFAVLAGLALGCAPASDRPTTDVVVVTPPDPVATAASVAPPVTSAAAAPVEIGDGAPLSPGLRQFTGMVRPTKGGFDVRSVTIDHGALVDALASQRPAGADSEWMLGARLRVTAELVKEGSDDPPPSGGLAEQSRAGTWFRVKRLERVEVVAPAVEIQGELARSKGLYSIAGHLVTADDLGWSLVVLNGQFEKKRVRLWGQPRTVVCEPHAQCLVGGSLPMFDVGRAEVIKP